MKSGGDVACESDARGLSVKTARCLCWCIAVGLVAPISPAEPTSRSLLQRVFEDSVGTRCANIATVAASPAIL